jgi:hypothetical protein
MCAADLGWMMDQHLFSLDCAAVQDPNARNCHSPGVLMGFSAAAQDPNARNCHGYRKFVKSSVLESPNNGYLAADTIVIRYTIELVVSTGGALTRQAGPAGPKLPIIEVRCGSG